MFTPRFVTVHKLFSEITLLSGCYYLLVRVFFSLIRSSYFFESFNTLIIRVFLISYIMSTLCYCFPIILPRFILKIL